jgi:hypothetical protein
MKTFALIFLLIVGAKSLDAQLYKFDGDWSGKITLTDGTTMWVRIVVSDGTVTQYFWDSDNSRWYTPSAVLAKSSYDKNNLIFYWMNDGGIWTETQTFMLSSVSDDKLYVVWSRQVDNQETTGDNNVWSLQGDGYFKEN